MRQPDIPLRVEIRRDGAYLSYETIKGSWRVACQEQAEKECSCFLAGLILLLQDILQ